MWIRTLHRVTWEALTGTDHLKQVWRVDPVEGYYDTRWLTALWSTQIKVEGIMPKAAWHWGRDSSVVNDPVGEPGC